MKRTSELGRIRLEYESKLKTVNNEHETIQVFLQYAAELLFVDFDQALDLAKKTQQMAVASRDKKLIAHSFRIITQANFRKGSYVLAILKASEAIGYYA